MTRSEYKRRRKALAKQIGANAIAILPAARERIRNRDVHYPFRQDSDFNYLTGFTEPDAFAVIAPKRKEGEFVVFCRPRDEGREQWDGSRLGVDGARTTLAADQAHPLSDLDDLMPTLIDGRQRLYYAVGHDAALDARVMGWVDQIKSRVRTGARAPDTFITIESLLHEQRLRKSKAEAQLMRRAATISAQAHRRLMRICTPGMCESDLDAEFQYACAIDGARHLAYPTIVGSGINACILHYTDNTDTLKDGDLVLIDAGCELDGYASDITRTFPVNGRFSRPQRQLYELVLKSQSAAIKKARPGCGWNEPHDAAVRVLTKGLVDLGILKGKLAKLIEDEAYKPYYMHRTGHWLGMDVHDVGDYKHDGEWRVFEPGMMLTIEPGLYMPSTDVVPKVYRGIGIRIEDDLLITEHGNEILSAAVPKHPDEIEALMATEADTLDPDGLCNGA